MNIETLLVQTGINIDKATGAISTPIYQSATFCHPDLGASTGYDYTRTGNPTRKVIEERLALLESGCAGFGFASGMAALTAVLLLLPEHATIIVSEDLYGGTYRLLEKVFRQYQINAIYADTTNPTIIEEIIQRNRVSALLVETPSNPLLKITDLGALAHMCRAHGILSIADNTFMTPYLQKPLEHGFDIVVHSGTKFLCGHNDTLSGFVVVNTPLLQEKMGEIQNTTGGILSPFDSWLVIRSLKTLSLRMDAIQKNAERLAEFLSGHKAVRRVLYPGLPTHPGYTLQKKQAKGSGGVISLYLDTKERAHKFIRRVRTLTFAESLGGVESLVTYPATQTHAAIPENIRERQGVTSTLVRISVGIEHIDDLLADVDQALQ